MTDKLTKITIVIPAHNRKDITLNCLRQLQLIDNSDINITTVVVDDGSTDGTSEAIAGKYPDAVVLHGDGNLWWSGATNEGVKWALEHSSDYVLTLNDDVKFDKDLLKYLLKTSKSNINTISCGIVCDTRNNKIVSAGKYANGFFKSEYASYLAGCDISYLPKNEYEMGIGCGCAVLIPISVFKKIGLFDSFKFPHHMGDMDFLLRARKKEIRIIINPKARIYTEIGGNYFHSHIVKESMLSNIKAFFDIKSTANLRTRYLFYKQHTPYHLGWLVFIYYILKMISILAAKVILPREMLYKLMKRRKKIPI